MKHPNQIRKQFKLKYGWNIQNQAKTPVQRQLEYIRKHNQRTEENLKQIRKWFAEQESEKGVQQSVVSEPVESNRNDLLNNLEKAPDLDKQQKVHLTKRMQRLSVFEKKKIQYPENGIQGVQKNKGFVKYSGKTDQQINLSHIRYLKPRHTFINRRLMYLNKIRRYVEQKHQAQFKPPTPLPPLSKLKTQIIVDLANNGISVHKKIMTVKYRVAGDRNNSEKQLDLLNYNNNLWKNSLTDTYVQPPPPPPQPETKKSEAQVAEQNSNKGQNGQQKPKVIPILLNTKQNMFQKGNQTPEQQAKTKPVNQTLMKPPELAKMNSNGSLTSSNQVNNPLVVPAQNKSSNPFYSKNIDNTSLIQTLFGMPAANTVKNQTPINNPFQNIAQKNQASNAFGINTNNTSHPFSSNSQVPKNPFTALINPSNNNISTTNTNTNTGNKLNPFGAITANNNRSYQSNPFNIKTPAYDNSYKPTQQSNPFNAIKNHNTTPTYQVYTNNFSSFNTSEIYSKDAAKLSQMAFQQMINPPSKSKADTSLGFGPALSEPATTATNRTGGFGNANKKKNLAPRAFN